MGLSYCCAVEDLADGSMVCRTVDGQRIVVCQVDGKLFAVNGVCSHERAYLDEGVLDGFLLYCPLHYSTFDVRTGEVVAPPADRGIASYPVVVEETRVLVDVNGTSGSEGEAVAKASAESADGTETRAESAESADGTETRDGMGRWGPASEGLSAPDAGVVPFLLRSRAVDRATGVAYSAVGGVRAKLRDSSLGTAVLDLLHGKSLGHPLHPAATDVPIGLWTAATIVDLAGGNDGVALAVGTVGTAGAMISIVTGVADWSVTDGPDRRIGFVHGAINLAALASQLAALYARARQSRMAVPCGLVSVALVGAAGYLGGHLVFGRGVMVDHTASHVGPLDWEHVVPLDEMASDGACAKAVAGRQVLVCREGEDVYAIDGICSHAGAVLSPAVSGGVVECPLHGSRFQAKDGAVVCGPATFPQPTLEVRVEDGWIAVRGRRV